MNRRAFTRAVLTVIGCAALSWAGTDPQTLLSDDQKRIQDATESYHQAVLHHGAASDDAKRAMDKMDAAKNQYRVDQLRVQELQQINANPTPATTPGANAGAAPQ